jgi:hypothetical protein
VRVSNKEAGFILSREQLQIAREAVEEAIESVEAEIDSYHVPDEAFETQEDRDRESAQKERLAKFNELLRVIRRRTKKSKTSSDLHAEVSRRSS